MTLFDATPMEASTATFSPCGLYRYTLGRRWGNGDLSCWLMLNPSTADESQDDPTIRRCIGFSKAWGYGGLTVVNIFAFRATDPDDMRKADDPVGPGNDAAIVEAAGRAAVVVAAWGVHGTFRERGRNVARLLRDNGVTLQCLGTTKDGHPKHPLYVAAATPLASFGVGTLQESGDDR